MTITFIDNPAAKSGFTTLNIDCAAILKSWKKSVYSYEWLDKNGAIKPASDLTQTENNKRFAVEQALKNNAPIEMPILGLGVMDNVEIGSGRAELLTLIDQGQQTMPVHVPTSQASEFSAFIAKNAQKSETGSILFYILIAVALLAALSFTIAKSTQGNGSGINEERANLIASELLTTTNLMAEATTAMRLRECSETDISFEAPGLSDHNNTSAPSDNSCHLFHINGGGLNYQPISNSAAPNQQTANWLFTGEIEIDGIGKTNGNDDGNELLALAINLNRPVCEKINELSNVTEPIPTQNLNDPDDWEGIYNYTDTIDNTALFNKRAGCFQNLTDNTYTFYRVLYRR